METASTDVINYIDGLKEYIVLEVDPASKSKMLDIENVILDGDNLKDVMILNESNHQFNGQELYEKLLKYQVELSIVAPQSNSSLLDMQDKSSWLNEQFGSKGFYSIYCLLSQIQLEVESLEIEALSQRN